MDLIELNLNNSWRHPWELARLTVISAFLKKVKGEGRLSILDIGSGDAFVASQLCQADENTRFYCVDTGYTKNVKDKIQDLLPCSNINLHQSLDDVQLSNGDSINVVTILDVIEHVPEPDTFFKQILAKSFISEKTKFIITVPAFPFLFNQHDIFLKHYRRYTLHSLQLHLEGVGLKVVDTGYFFFTLLFPRIFALICEKIKKEKLDLPPNLGTWDKGYAVTHSIKFILEMDYLIGHLLRKFGIQLPGLSSFAICKKA